MDRKQEAEGAVAELLQLMPDFPTNGPLLINHFVKLEHLGQSMLEGLRKAGLRL